MKFDRMSAWCEISECGRYTVTGHLVSKDPPRFGYQAWRRAPKESKELATLLGTKDGAPAARQLCIDDAMKAGAA